MKQNKKWNQNLNLEAFQARVKMGLPNTFLCKMLLIKWGVFEAQLSCHDNRNNYDESTSLHSSAF